MGETVELTGNARESFFQDLSGAPAYILYVSHEISKRMTRAWSMFRKTIYLGSWTINSPSRDAPTSTESPPPSPHSWGHPVPRIHFYVRTSWRTYCRCCHVFARCRPVSRNCKRNLISPSEFHALRAAETAFGRVCEFSRVGKFNICGIFNSPAE